MTPKVEQLPVPKLPDAPGPAPVIQNQPTGQKPGRKSATPTFINASAVPSKGSIGQKQLVGQ